jgi:hypothetical protein
VEFSSQSIRSIRRVSVRIVGAAVLAPALLVVAGLGSAAFASTTTAAAVPQPQTTVNGGNYPSLTACDYAGNVIVAVDGYHSFTCVGTYDGPKGDETAVWTLYLTK